MRFIDAAAFKAAEGTEAALIAGLRREIDGAVAQAEAAEATDVDHGWIMVRYVHDPATEAARQRLSDECGRLATRERELLARIGELQFEIDELKRKARR
jgi:hypothetical protein